MENATVTIDRAKILEQMSSHQTPDVECRQEFEALVRNTLNDLRKNNPKRTLYSRLANRIKKIIKSSN